MCNMLQPIGQLSYIALGHFHVHFLVNIHTKDCVRTHVRTYVPYVRRTGTNQLNCRTGTEQSESESSKQEAESESESGQREREPWA